MATITIDGYSATNVIDTIVYVPQERPADDLDVSTDKHVTYWFHGPFATEGPWDASAMEQAKSSFPKYRETGWWERKTAVTTTVTERL